MLITFTCQLLSSSLFSPLLSFLSSDRDHRDLHPFPTRRSAPLIGTWAIDKLIRFCLVTRHSDPIVWDFGSAAKHHDLFNPWLHETHMEADADPHAPHHGAVRPRQESGARAGISTLRGSFPPSAGIAEEVARKVKRELEKFGVAGEPLGVDIVELPILFALQAQGDRKGG